MKLDELLEGSELTKAELSRQLGISKPAITKWVEVPAKWLPVIKDLLNGEVRVRDVADDIIFKEGEPDDPFDLSDDELKLIIRSRSNFGTDYKLCQHYGWKINRFRKAVDGWVKRNPYKKPKDGYDLSKYVKGGVV